MPRPLEIAHVIHSGAVGGGPRVVLDLATRVPGRYTIIAADDGPLLTDAASAGIDTFSLRFAGEFSFAVSIPRLIVRLRSADIVHLHGQYAAFYGAIAAAAARVPAIYTAHFPSFVTNAGWRNAARNHFAELLPSRLSAFVVACSETSRHEYLRRRLVKNDRITTIYNGVSAQQPTQPPALTRTELGLAPDAPVVLAIGRFTRQKGFDLLLDALPLLLETVPSAKLVLVGDGEERPRLEAQVGRLDVNGAVQFLGFRRDVANLLAVASVVAVPSRYDVFPLVPLEAMMAERPVVASNLPVLREAIDDGVTGLLTSQEPAQLSAALSRVLLHDQLALEMGSKAGERARSHFGVERMVQDYIHLYESVVRSKQ